MATAAHRKLYLKSPKMRGDDVRELQKGLNNRRRARGLAPIKVDGIYGGTTAAAMREMAFQLGALDSTIQQGATVGIQRMIRYPGTRTPGQKARAQQRKKRNAKPKIVRLRAPMTNNQGSIGHVTDLVGHYTAGPRDRGDAHGLSLLRGYNDQHRRQRWGAIGYHIAILSSGTIVLLRPTAWRGTHVAGGNTGRIGVVVLGGPGQRMTAAQRASWKWLVEKGHTSAMPASHRLPKNPKLRVHNDLNSTACPGAYENDYKKAA